MAEMKPLVPPGLMRGDYNPFVPPPGNDPYPQYEQLRRETPIFFSPVLNMWIVTRHEDISNIVRDARFSSMNKLDPTVSLPPEVVAILKEGHPFMPTLVDNDPPGHTRFRNLLGKAFSPQRIMSLEPRVRDIAERLIEAFEKQGHVEIVSSFSTRLPLYVITGLLGLPEADAQQIKSWSDEWAALLFERLSPERQLECARGIIQFQRYLELAIDERRQNRKDDLLSDFIYARAEGVEPLGTAELISLMVSLIIAGHRTTMDVISNGVLLLCRQPEQAAALRENPDRLSDFIDELLRFEAPVTGMARTATQEVKIAGVTIPAGARLFLLFASANRDEDVFPDPKRFEPHRSNLSNHVSFGRGLHYCIGVHLGRMEIRIALELVLERLPNLRLRAGEAIAPSVPQLIHRGIGRLVVEWDAR